MSTAVTSAAAYLTEQLATIDTEITELTAARTLVAAALAALDQPAPVVPNRIPEGAPVVVPAAPPPKPDKAGRRPPKPASCPHCDYIAGSKAGLSQHVKHKHPVRPRATDPRPVAEIGPRRHREGDLTGLVFTCGTCEFGTPNVRDITAHTLTEHRRPPTAPERTPHPKDIAS